MLHVLFAIRSRFVFCEALLGFALLSPKFVAAAVDQQRSREAEAAMESGCVAVIDVGSGSVKAGWAGDDCPTAMPAAVALPNSKPATGARIDVRSTSRKQNQQHRNESEVCAQIWLKFDAWWLRVCSVWSSKAATHWVLGCIRCRGARCATGSSWSGSGGTCSSKKWRCRTPKPSR